MPPMAGLSFQSLLGLLATQHESEVRELHLALQQCQAKLSGCQLRQSGSADSSLEHEVPINIRMAELSDPVPTERKPLRLAEDTEGVYAELKRPITPNGHSTFDSPFVGEGEVKEQGYVVKATLLTNCPRSLEDVLEADTGSKSDISMSDCHSESPAVAPLASVKGYGKSPLRKGNSIDDLGQFDNEWHQRVHELKVWFDRLWQHYAADDADNVCLSPQMVMEMMKTVEGTYTRKLDWVENTIADFNRACGNIVRDGASLSFEIMANEDELDNLAFAAFSELILWEDVMPHLDGPSMRSALEIRTTLISHSVDELIVMHSRLDMPDHETNVSKTSWWVDTVVEPTTILAIVINAIVIGVSADIAWDGWYGVEVGFTIFFVCEIVVKVSIHGFLTQYFTCDERWWNWFDMAVVILAVVDLIATSVSKGENDMSNTTMMRLARLARLTRIMRLLRLLRLRCFKELLLMVKGVLAGMRTLFWAFVLLMSCVYIVAIILRQTIGRKSQRIQDDAYNTTLFSTLPWSIFMVFRCFTDDCELANGTPLVGHLYEIFGLNFAVPYVFIMLFITFGLCNLIMAIFVENVNEAAKAKRQLSHKEECSRVCKGMRSLVMMFGGEVKDEAKLMENDGWLVQTIKTVGKAVGIFAPETARKSITWAASRSMSASLSSAKSGSTQDESGEPAPSAAFFQFGGQISRKQFEKVMEYRDTHDVLDDLDIHVTDRGEIFDVLDADNSGFVDLSELIAGLLKLRTGGADKSDTVATILGIRSLRKQMDTLFEQLQEYQNSMNEIIIELRPSEDSPDSKNTTGEIVKLNSGHSPNKHKRLSRQKS